jgi:predicted anti-sigma-YlaC factor YlaD
MDCTLMQAVLPNYTDDELTEEATRLVREHLAYCAECAREARDIRRAGEALQVFTVPTRPSPEFRERLLTQLSAEHRRHKGIPPADRDQRVHWRPVLWDLNRKESANG